MEKELWQYFFSKPKKNYNIYMYEMPNYPNHLIFDDEYITSLKGKWSKELFENDNPLHVEIGSGSANFTNNKAKINSNINFLGFEIRFKRLVQAAKKAKRDNLENLKFIKKRISSLRDIFNENELDGLYINFPDPWEGEEHKRIFTENLLKDLDVVLKKDAIIYFKTDHLGYYLDVLEIVNNSEGYDVIYSTNDIHNSAKKEENIMTEFEHLFISKHKMEIKYIEIIKR